MSEAGTCLFCLDQTGGSSQALGGSAFGFRISVEFVWLKGRIASSRTWMGIAHLPTSKQATWAWVKIKPPGIGPRVVVLVSICQGSTPKLPFFNHQPGLLRVPLLHWLKITDFRKRGSDPSQFLASFSVSGFCSFFGSGPATSSRFCFCKAIPLGLRNHLFFGLPPLFVQRPGILPCGRPFGRSWETKEICPRNRLGA